MNLKRFANVVEHAGSGLKMPEDAARTIEGLSKNLPAECSYRRRSMTPDEFSLSAGERSDLSIISTWSPDRDREVVLSKGLDRNGYNGVVPFAHRYNELPVGKCVRMDPVRDGAAMLAKTFYPEKPADWGNATWMPSAVLHLMQNGVCTGKSVGFLPLEIRAATPQEKSAHPDWEDCPIIARAALIEYSVVPVPCQAEAEMMAVSKAFTAGVIDKSVADFLTESLAPKAIIEPPPTCYKCKGAMASTKPECFRCEKCGIEYSTKSETPIVVDDKTMTDTNTALQTDEDDMPNCPTCNSSANVSKKGDGGIYTCSTCGNDFTPETDPDMTKSVKAMKLNGPCISTAKRLIAEGNVDHGEWVAPVGSERKPEECLLVDLDAPAAAQCKYPIIKGGQLYSRAVSNAAARAEQNGEADVAATAKNLSDLIEKHAGKSLLNEPFRSPESIVKSIELHRAANEKQAREDAEQAMADVLTLARGS